MVATMVLVFFVEFLSHLKIFKNTYKIYLFLARTFKWKKLKVAAKYPKKLSKKLKMSFLR